MSAPGDVLAERYELGPRVGRGGMSEVFRARDLVLSRQVAVKVLAQEFVTDEDFLVRFRREAQNAAALNHPNVVAVYDSGADGDSHFIVMEFVEGSSVEDMLRAGGALDRPRALEIAVSVLSALEAAHHRGLVHRDIKPSNILVRDDGSVKVADFGIARAVADVTMTRSGTVIGSAPYLSPEQARDDDVDARSDLYSMGCVLYAMLTGKPPFTGDAPVAVASQHVTSIPDAPSTRRPDLPPAFDTVVMTALAKQPGARYDDAAAMRADIQRLQSGIAPAATPDRTQLLEGTAVAAGDAATRVMGSPQPVSRQRTTVRTQAPPPRQDNRLARGLLLFVLALIALFVVIGLLVSSGIFDGGGDVAPSPEPSVAPTTTSEAPSPEPTTQAPTQEPTTQAPTQEPTPTTAPSTPPPSSPPTVGATVTP